MKIFPAIDIKDGMAVRLYQGDYDKVTVYGSDPAEIALGFSESGAKNLHIVDLDGARDGSPANFEIIGKIVEGSGLFVQAGGGIRDEARIARYLKLGVSRVILGTAALTDFGFLCEMVKKYGGRIAVSVDASGGRAAIKGWTEVTDTDGMEFCEKLAAAGVETVIYTDISKDGAMGGTNMAAYDRLSTIGGLNVIASGGVSSEDEILQLKNKGIYGTILGKALYSGALNLKRAIKIGEDK